MCGCVVGAVFRLRNGQMVEGAMIGCNEEAYVLGGGVCCELLKLCLVYFAVKGDGCNARVSY